MTLRLLFIFTLFSTFGCAQNTTSTQESTSPEACGSEYASKRNSLVERVDLLILRVEVETTGIRSESKPVEEKLIEDLKKADADLTIFLADYHDYKCRGRVLECKPEYAKDYQCYLNPSQSTYVEKIIENKSLWNARTYLREQISVLSEKRNPPTP